MNHTDETEDDIPKTKDYNLESLLENETPAGEMVPATAQVVEDISADSKVVLDDILDAEVISEEMSTIVQKEPPAQLQQTEAGVYQLANAMVGRAYSVAINLRDLKIAEAVLDLSLFAKQTEKLGLTTEQGNGVLKIEGTPNAEATGEHELFLDFTLDKTQVYRMRFQLLVNPDPKSLWKEIEPDATAPYQKSHTATAQLTSNDFQVIAASRRGRSHAQEGKFREDDFAVRVCENGWHLLVVSDGAGSAQFSREGSRLACQTAIEVLDSKVAELLEPKIDGFISADEATRPEAEKEMRNILYQILAGAAFASYKRLEKEAQETGNPIKDYSCTFLTAIVKKHQNKKFIASFGIGDGAIAVFDDKHQPMSVELMNSPDGGEFSGQTRFLTMREIIGDSSEMLRRIKFISVEEFTLLFLMTDGISDPKFGTDKNLVEPQKWYDLCEDLLTKVSFKWGNSETASQLLDWMNFWAPGEHDDRTLAILY